jgi:hypothetical protein
MTDVLRIIDYERLLALIDSRTKEIITNHEATIQRVTILENASDGVTLTHIANPVKGVALAGFGLGGFDDRITTSQTTASTAQTTANTAQTTANGAQTTANTAVTNAATAQSTANNAQTTANTAVTNAATAQSTANGAQADATSALATLTHIADPVGAVLAGYGVGGFNARLSALESVTDYVGKSCYLSFAAANVNNLPNGTLSFWTNWSSVSFHNHTGIAITYNAVGGDLNIATPGIAWGIKVTFTANNNMGDFNTGLVDILLGVTGQNPGIMWAKGSVDPATYSVYVYAADFGPLFIRFSHTAGGNIDFTNMIVHFKLTRLT